MNFQIAPSVVEHWLIECVSQSIRRGLTGKSHSKANVERSNTLLSKPLPTRRGGGSLNRNKSVTAPHAERPIQC